MSQSKSPQVFQFVPSFGRKIGPDKRESIPLTEASDRLVEQGIAAAHANRHAEAVRLFDQALEVNDKNIEALLWRGALSPAEASLSFLERALALDPTNEKARHGVAWARQRAGLVKNQDAAQPAPSPLSARPAPEPSPRVAPVAPKVAVVAPRVAAVAPKVGPVAPPVRSASPAAAPGAMRTHGLHIAAAVTRLLSILIDRPMIALAIAVMVMALLATGAMARGVSKADLPPVTPVAGARSASAPVISGLPSPVAGPTGTKALTTTVATARLVAPTPTPPLVISVASFEEAWASGDWARVIPIGEDLLKRNPMDDNLAKRMVDAYYKQSVPLIRSGRLAEGVALLDKALQIDANNVDVRDERRYAKLYLDGITGLTEGDYITAITNLKMLYDMNSRYLEVAAKLYDSYIGRGKKLEADGKKTDAYVEFQKAWRVNTKGTEATAGMARLQGSAPQTVINSAGKKIEVSIANQQVIVYQNNNVLWRFKASTGKYPYTTRPGYYEILNHLPHAYSSALGWNMPYWMGIYQAGGTENGFHGMAILGNGKEVSTSVLGRPATAGCIMLSNPDASQLYNWATEGTQVWIH